MHKTYCINMFFVFFQNVLGANLQLLFIVAMKLNFKIKLVSAL